MNKYQTETNDIIQGLQQRVQEREADNKRLKSEPDLYYKDEELNTQSEECVNPDELLFKVRCGLDQKFKSFYDRSTDDVKIWKQAVTQEVLEFTQFLELKHLELVQNFKSEIEEFTPVLRDRFVE